MGKVEKSIEIRAPLEKVWEMLALDRLPEWDENYKNVEYTSRRACAPLFLYFIL